MVILANRQLVPCGSGFIDIAEFKQARETRDYLGIFIKEVRKYIYRCRMKTSAILWLRKIFKLCRYIGIKVDNLNLFIALALLAFSFQLSFYTALCL